MTKDQKIKAVTDFIIEKSLDFNDNGSGLNSKCCEVSGYALHVGLKESDDVIQAIGKSFIKIPSASIIMRYEKEMHRVFRYAKSNNYGDFYKKSKK